MDLLALVRVLARRWYLALPLLGFTLLLTIVSYAKVTPVYEARGSMLLFAPALADDAEGRANPYLLYGNLKVAANVVSEVVSQPEIQEELAAAGASGDYEVGTDPMTIEPTVVVVATGRDDVAPRTVLAVMQVFDRELRAAQEQASAPTRTWITTRVVTPPGELTEQFGGKLRVVAVVLFLGCAVTVITSFTADALARSRARREEGVEAPEGDVAPAGVPVPATAAAGPSTRWTDGPPPPEPAPPSPVPAAPSAQPRPASRPPAARPQQPAPRPVATGPKRQQQPQPASRPAAAQQHPQATPRPAAGPQQQPQPALRPAAAAPPSQPARPAEAAAPPPARPADGDAPRPQSPARSAQPPPPPHATEPAPAPAPAPAPQPAPKEPVGAAPSKPHPYLVGRNAADAEDCSICGLPMRNAADYRQHLDAVHRTGPEAEQAVGQRP